MLCRLGLNSNPSLIPAIISGLSNCSRRRTVLDPPHSLLNSLLSEKCLEEELIANTIATISSLHDFYPQPLNDCLSLLLRCGVLYIFFPTANLPSSPFSSSSHSLVQNTTDKMLTEYLAKSSQRSSLVMPSVIRPQPRSARERQTCSPISFRAMSPSCRGLLDVSELASEPAIPFGSVVIKIPPPTQRPMSPQGSGRSSSPQHVSSVFRRQNISRASPTLGSVKEENNTSST
ncbi:unnamed protein product [Hymenolepis diminuta]|uniref:Uncharacterized protein n=1 Tax=Hymenolepis diminuta TaxID=6216 RepID=A0A564YZY4_HYMDI|nr:unnamed protein product [Hymenolepis diminuta]